MKQKIVLKVPMMTDDHMSRSKAMKISASMTGTMTVAVEGNDNDQFVVVGDGVDVVELTRRLRKTMGHTELMSVEEVHKNTDKKDDEGGGEKKDKGGGGMGGGGSEKKDKEGGGRSGEKNDKANGELRKMGADKVFVGWFTHGPSTCAEANLHELRREFACFCTNRLTIL